MLIFGRNHGSKFNFMDFLNKYSHSKNKRFSSFKKALEIAKSRDLKTFVETGTSRGKIKFFFFLKYNWKDGMSTLIFSEYVKNNNGHLFTCDINPINIKNSKKFVNVSEKFVTFVVDDSINFLKNFKNHIDFLYLDSLDGQDPSSSEHQLNEIEESYLKLHKNSLVLLDDKGAKTKLSLSFMLKNNFKILNETNEQVLLGF